MLYVRWRLIYLKGIFSRNCPVIVVLISAQCYDSIADCDLSLAMMKELIWKNQYFSLENSHFHGGNFSSVLFVKPFHGKPVILFLYISPILLGNIVVLILMTVVIISLPRPWRELAFIAESYSRSKYNFHSWLIAWRGNFYFTWPLSECKGFYKPLDDQQSFLSFEIN